jgi:glycosyltransferase involved in cell wall biosynthesis
MNILIIHEVDWIKKITFEPHHLAELFSLEGNNVFVIDCQEPDQTKILDGLKKETIKEFNRVYDDAKITLIHPPSLLIKGFNRITNYWSCKKVIKETIIKNKIDLILLYGAATNGIQSISVARELNIPVIFRLLDIAHGLVKIPIIRQLAKRNEQIVIQNSTEVLPTTPELCEYAIKMGAKKESTHHFSLGIDLRYFKPKNRDEDLAKNLGIEKDDKIILFMGTLYDFSGLPNIINNFSKLEQKFKQIKLLIVGGGPSIKSLKNIINIKKQEKNVIVTGFVPQKEIPNYISLANICINSFEVNYVTNSIIPTKVLEYLACGKAVLSTPLKGTKELLPDEEFGVKYAPTENFIQSLEKFLENQNKLDDWGKNGYEHVKEFYNWNILAKELLEKCGEIIKDRS